MKKKKEIRKSSLKKKAAKEKKKRPVKKKSVATNSKMENTQPEPAKKTVLQKAEHFPGYPHYPSADDIMNPRKGYQKMELIESSRRLVKRGKKLDSGKPETEQMEKPLGAEEEAVDEERTASDVTVDEKRLLEADELSEDMGEDEELRTRVWDVDVSGSDLDIPGAELDDEEEDLGEEDEENNLYSLGGDRHEDMEQSHDPGR